MAAEAAAVDLHLARLAPLVRLDHLVRPVHLGHLARKEAPSGLRSCRRPDRPYRQGYLHRLAAQHRQPSWR